MAVKTFQKIADARAYLNQKKDQKIALIPTMGALHEGHISLVKKAQAECDIVVVSIFVNPIQFGPTEDLNKYPRKIGSDKKILEKEKVDLLFLPNAEEVYDQNFCTFVAVEELTQKLCGLRRPGHFRGVSTIVAKLFNIIQPDVSYFGQKDYQQFLVIKKMVQDLNFNLEIKSCPIIRDKDGLALSSRNSYLSEKNRREASIIFKSFSLAKKLVKNGEKDVETLKRKISENIIKNSSGKIDYLEILDSEDLSEITMVKRGSIILVAAFWEDTRLIDNMIF